jgi:hypothetical protein
MARRDIQVHKRKAEFPLGCSLRAISAMSWIWKRKPLREGFPVQFRAQRIRISEVLAIADLPPRSIAAYFRERLDLADRLVAESEDKRFTPSTFITQAGDEYKVDWCTRRGHYECVQTFSDLADAATDYLLFSLGRGRWTCSPNSAGR